MLSLCRIWHIIITDAEEKGFIAPGKVRGGMLDLRSRRLPMAPLPCAVWHRLQSRHSEHLQLLSLVCSSPPVAMSSWPSSHGYGGCSRFMAMSYLCNPAYVYVACSCELSYQLYVCAIEPMICGMVMW
jgi:hypothetical protein